jgi:hypothetical protein
MLNDKTFRKLNIALMIQLVLLVVLLIIQALNFISKD